MRLELLPVAREDIANAAEWYDAIRPDLGEQFLHRLDALLARLLEHPLSAPLYFLEYRAVVLGKYPYRLVYRVTDDALVVVALRHISRDPEDLKSGLVERP